MMKHLETMAIVLLAVICLGTAAFFGYKIIMQQLEYKEGDETYERLIELAEDGDPDESPDSPESSKEQELSDTQNTEENVPEIDFDALGEIGGNMKAWLYQPDTVINYPVAQGEDNSYYLYHLADGTYNQNGCLFMDHKNNPDFTDDNTVIYGHHMRSGSMFASLVKYADQAYYEVHPVFYLVTRRGRYRLEIFSAYTTTRDSDAYILKFATKEEKDEWLVKVGEESDIRTGKQVSENDHIVTLSTCDYSFHDARYVVHAKLVPIL